MRVSRIHCALLVAMTLLGCESPEPGNEAAPRGRIEPAPEGPPNVLLVVIDTLRADRLSSYGHDRPTSPHLDALANEGVRFANAYAPCSWTRPSVATIFTGAFPQRHTVQMRSAKLPQRFETLAERFSKHGYETVMVNTNPHLADVWEMSRGFADREHLMPHPDIFKAGNGANVVERTVRQKVRALKEPFFLYTHFIDPHYPYEPPASDLEAIGVKGKDPSSLSRYDGEIHFVDKHIKSMMHFLEREKKLQNTIVMVTSDHGDEFLEHGSIGHGWTLYEEVVHVPLILWMPKALRQRYLGKDFCTVVEQNVSIADVMPTLLGLVGAPGKVADGMDLMPLVKCESQEPRPLFFSVEKEGRSRGAVLLEKAKLIVERSSGRSRMYLLDEDPKEKGPDGPRSKEALELKAHLEGLLSDFESSVRPGMHVELAGKDDDRFKQKVFLRLRTDGRFSDVQTYGLERLETTTLNDEGNVLTINTRLDAHWHRSPKHVWVQDRDEVRFTLVPPDASVAVTARLDGSRAPARWMRFPLSSGPFPKKLAREDILMQEDIVDRQAPGLYLYEQKAPATEADENLPEEITTALRALGYIH